MLHPPARFAKDGCEDPAEGMPAASVVATRWQSNHCCWFAEAVPVVPTVVAEFDVDVVGMMDSDVDGQKIHNRALIC